MNNSLQSNTTTVFNPIHQHRTTRNRDRHSATINKQWTMDNLQPTTNNNTTDNNNTNKDNTLDRTTNPPLPKPNMNSLLWRLCMSIQTTNFQPTNSKQPTQFQFNQLNLKQSISISNQPIQFHSNNERQSSLQYNISLQSNTTTWDNSQLKQKLCNNQQ